MYVHVHTPSIAQILQMYRDIISPLSLDWLQKFVHVACGLQLRECGVSTACTVSNNMCMEVISGRGYVHLKSCNAHVHDTGNCGDGQGWMHMSMYIPIQYMGMHGAWAGYVLALTEQQCLCGCTRVYCALEMVRARQTH